MKEELVIQATRLFKGDLFFSPLSFDYKVVAHFSLRAEPPHARLPISEASYINKSISCLSLCLSVNSFCTETQRSWASVSPDTKWVNELKDYDLSPNLRFDLEKSRFESWPYRFKSHSALHGFNVTWFLWPSKIYSYSGSLNSSPNPLQSWIRVWFQSKSFYKYLLNTPGTTVCITNK